MKGDSLVTCLVLVVRTGEQLSEDQDPGGLLLLRFRLADPDNQPRQKLRRNGPSNDRDYPRRQVRVRYLHVTICT